MARTRSMIAVLVAASLMLVLYDLRIQDGGLRSVLSATVEPLQRTVTAVFSPLGVWATRTQEFADPVSRQRTAAAISTSVALPAGFDAVAGRVVSADVTMTRALVGVDVGADDGVRIHNAVVGPNGLVGDVVSVSARTCWVRLLTDPGSLIGVRLLTSGEMATLSGRGTGRALAVRILNPGATPTIGEPLVSLGELERDGIPADLPVAHLTTVDPDLPAAGRSATAEPRSSLTALRDVVVLVPEAQ